MGAGVYFAMQHWPPTGREDEDNFIFGGITRV
jgi:hypothetical protein